MPLDYYVWAIVGEGRTIVVDTGFDVTMAKKRARKIVHPVEERLIGAYGLRKGCLAAIGQVLLQGSTDDLAPALRGGFGGPIERLNQFVRHIDHDALGAHWSQHSSRGLDQEQGNWTDKNETTQTAGIRMAGSSGLNTIPDAGFG